MPPDDEAEIRFNRVGLDGPLAPTPVPRLFTFESVGPGDVSATLADVSAGEVEMCLWIGDRENVSQRTCRQMEEGTLSASTTAAGTTQWTVSLIGIVTAPNVTLVLRFSNPSPAVAIDDFRFQGTEFPGYNGVVAVLQPAEAGTLEMQTLFDDGADGSYPYRLTLEPTAGGPVDSETGTAREVDYSTPVTPVRHRLTLQNTQEVATEEVFLRAVIRWP